MFRVLCSGPRKPLRPVSFAVGSGSSSRRTKCCGGLQRIWVRRTSQKNDVPARPRASQRRDSRDGDVPTIAGGATPSRCESGEHRSRETARRCGWLHCSLRSRIAISGTEVPPGSRSSRARRIDGKRRHRSRQRHHGIVLCAAPKERAQHPKMGHPRRAAHSDNHLDRTHLQPAKTTTIAPTPNTHRIRDDHDPNSSTRCINQTCHLNVQQTP